MLSVPSFFALWLKDGHILWNKAGLLLERFRVGKAWLCGSRLSALQKVGGLLHGMCRVGTGTTRCTHVG